MSAEPQVALIVGGGPGISASCARLFKQSGMQVAVAARNPDKPALISLTQNYNTQVFACNATEPDEVKALFEAVSQNLGVPRLVVHNIDGRSAEVFRREITDVEPELVLSTLKNSTFSAFLVGQQAARHMLAKPLTNGHHGTLIFTNASAALKGYPKSGAFAAASHGKRGLAESMARELMPKGIHVAHVPIDAAIGWRQPDGTRAHRLAGTSEDDNMADPDFIAETYLQLHQQHRSTWGFEIVLRPWNENW